jgi:hypothetical protein
MSLDATEVLGNRMNDLSRTLIVIARLVYLIEQMEKRIKNLEERTSALESRRDRAASDGGVEIADGTEY